MLTATTGMENSKMVPDRIKASPVSYSDLSNSTRMESAKISEIMEEDSTATTSKIPTLFPSTNKKL